eukprot:184462_1
MLHNHQLIIHQSMTLMTAPHVEAPPNEEAKSLPHRNHLKMNYCTCIYKYSHAFIHNASVHNASTPNPHAFIHNISVPESTICQSMSTNDEETFILSRPPPVEYDLYESIISGNIGNVNTNEDNCYHVLKYNTIITLNRVVIEDGNANYEYGGPEIRDNLNEFGGGLITNDILAQQQYITISDSKFRNNEALGGGALWFGSSNRCNGCNMEGGYGGAIYAYDHVTMIITQALFENYFAHFRGDALYQGFG